jgi:dienelactone hydrolase
MMPYVTRRKFIHSAAAAAGLVVPGGSNAPVGSVVHNGSEVPWLEEIQEPPPGDLEQRPSLLVSSNGEAIGALSAWNEQRKTIRERWVDYVGPLDSNPNPPQLEVLEEDYPTGVVRRLVEYEGEPGIRVRGYLLVPRVIDRPRPGIVVFHSTVDHTIRQPAGLEGNPAKAFGLHLAQMGCVTFCPECFLWHERDESDYYERTERFFARHSDATGMAKMLFDAQRAVDVLESLDTVDPDRLGTIGHSLGAKEVIYLAAFDDRITATVSSEGGISTQFSNWEAPWYLGEAIDRFDHDHEELLALIAPRPFLLIGGGSADGSRSWPFIEAVLPVYELFGDRPSIGLLDHEQGHAVPRVAEHRAYQWLLTYV